MAQQIILLTHDEANAAAQMALDWMSSSEAGELYGSDVYYDLVRIRENLINPEALDQDSPVILERDFWLVSELLDFHCDFLEEEEMKKFSKLIQLLAP